MHDVYYKAVDSINLQLVKPQRMVTQEKNPLCEQWSLYGRHLI